eukprot:Clim_evm88s215 gene=Clim_evmTU88s215
MRAQQTDIDLSQWTIPNDVPVALLDCKAAFKNLTHQEKAYAHYLSEASWAGALIVLLQTSPEAPGIFLLLQALFHGDDISALEAVCTDAGLTEDESNAIYTYAAAFYCNMGNYKFVGSTKFIPKLSSEKFEAVVKKSSACKADEKYVGALWDDIKEAMYSLDPRRQQLGLGVSNGLTTYWSSNCEKDDAVFVQDFLDTKEIPAYNTRCFKEGDAYHILIASAEKTELPCTREFEHKGKKFYVKTGDYGPLLARVCENLTKAKDHAANETEARMLEKYIESFTTGSLDAHKDASRSWVTNKGPIVETYMGFWLQYRDPFGTRGEWSGFTAVVNKERSRKLQILVDKTADLLKEMPWPEFFEKENFLQPDFTSLDVITFASSVIPGGINLPSYSEVNSKEGFKNVSLDNVSSAQLSAAKSTFIQDSDLQLYKYLVPPMNEVHVALHELFGHGSGRLVFEEDLAGKDVMHPFTKEKITQAYKKNESFFGKFSSVASAYEECRAECVTLHLSCIRDILKIFGHEDGKAEDILYVLWLRMAQSGLTALADYNSATGEWGQAHSQARFCILRVLLEEGEGVLVIKEITGEDGKPDLILKVDRRKIDSHGRPSIAHFLAKLQVYKAIADTEQGVKMYNRYSTVNEYFSNLRKIVLARRKPSAMLVQVDTTVDKDGAVSLQPFEATVQGICSSMKTRYPAADAQLYALWKTEADFHQYHPLQ